MELHRTLALQEALQLPIHDLRSECRAYDTLIARGLNGKATPYCHGWLSLDKALDTILQKKILRSVRVGIAHRSQRMNRCMVCCLSTSTVMPSITIGRN